MRLLLRSDVATPELGRTGISKGENSTLPRVWDSARQYAIDGAFTAHNGYSYVTSDISVETGIHLKQARVDRGGQTVLHDLDLSITQHRVAIVGRNGSGKSTLARLIKGILRPSSGTVRLYGRDPAKRDFDSLSVAGFLFQNSDHQILCPNVFEEIAFGLSENGTSSKRIDSTVMALLQHYGIADWRDRAVATLSEGQRRLVCLLAVLIMQPKVILLDEPFNGLDIPTRNRLKRFIADLPHQVLMITHDIDSLNDFDRVLWIEKGRIHADGRPESILPAFAVAMQAAVERESSWEM